MSKRMLVVILLMACVLLLSSCGAEIGDKNVWVRQDYKIDCTEFYSVATHNGYKCVSLDTQIDDSGKYTLIMEFDTFDKEARHD